MQDNTNHAVADDAVARRPIRILHLEDSAVDAELISERLTLGGIPHTTEQVLTRDQFRAALERGGFDLILSDFSLPSFDGMGALDLAKQMAPDTPFVIVSGVMGEDVAVTSLKQGATDFVVKQRLERLPATVLRALEDTRRRAEHKRTLEALQASEARLQRAVKDAPFPIMIHAEDGEVVQISRAWTELTGYSQAELPDIAAWTALAYPGHTHDVLERIEQLYRLGARKDEGEYEVLTRAGERRIWNFASAPIGTDQSGRRLVVSMAMDMTERKAAEQAFRESEERLRLALNAAQAGTWHWDVAADRFEWSQEFSALAGLPAHGPDRGGRGPALDDWLATVHDDDRGLLEDGLREALDGRRTDFRLEYRVVHPYKGLRWLLGFGRAGYDAEGRPIRITGLSLDITERKEAEDRQLLLAREVDHRARNLLAVVQAMLSLTRADTIDGFVAAVKGRVAALSRAHALLSENRWAGVELAQLVREEMGAFAGAGHVRLDGPPVTLHAEATQAVTVVLHELATNAVKYGALSAPEGRVDIVWRVDDRGVEVEWTESGGPPIETGDIRQGFGSQIMHASARQLGGELRQELAPGGLTAHFRIAAINVTTGEVRPLRQPVPDQGGPPVPAGARVLLVEDNGFVALELERLLGQLGCSVVGPASTLARAMELIQAGTDLDAAVLDINLGGGADSFPIAQELAARGIPYLFCTGYDRRIAERPEAGPAEVLAKPVQRDQLANAMTRLLAPHANTDPAAEAGRRRAVGS